MPEPCIQAGPIGELKATVSGVKDTLERLADGQERFIEVLERIASQGTEIESLKSGQTILFTRIRQVELDASAERVKVGGMVAGISFIVTAVTTFLFRHVKG